MIDLSVRFDEAKYEKIIAKAVLFGKDINKAINQAAKEAAATGKAETKRQMVAKYTLSSTEIGKTIKAKSWSMGAKMQITDYPRDIFSFKKVKPKSKVIPGSGRNLVDVNIEIKKGRRFSGERRFAGVLNKKQKQVRVYRQDDVKQNVFTRYHGPTTVGMFKAEEEGEKIIYEPVKEIILVTLDKRMQHHLERLLNG